MPRVCILDYGSGNVRSVFNLFESLSDQTVVSNDPQVLADATHVVLPGVGAFGASMRKIQENIPLDALREHVVERGKPFLGICVGMQVLADVGTEFGEHEGLGLIAGRVDRLESGSLPLPHIGWNNVGVVGSDPLFAGLENGPDFYFLHSYVFNPSERGVVLAETEFGATFGSAIRQDNVIGVQFHPEKSQSAGRRLVSNFLGIS